MRPRGRPFLGLLGVAALQAAVLAGCRKQGGTAGAPARAAARPPLLLPVPSALRWPLAPGWKREAFVLPPEFAPTFPQGEEEVRFPPGFRSPSSKEFWSYALVWLLPEHQPVDGQQLSDLLETYFRGLCPAMAAGRFPVKGEDIRAHLVPASEPLMGQGDGPDGQTYRGTLETLDCMGSGQPLTLHVRLSPQSCPQSQRRVVLVLASPQPDGELVWHELTERSRELTCL